MGYGDIARGYQGNAAGYQTNAAGYQANAAGLQGSVQNRLAMAQFQQGMPWYNLNQYAGLLGSPVMQDKGGWSTASGTGSGSGSGWNANAGLN
jgi:hypothetical protein